MIVSIVIVLPVTHIITFALIGETIFSGEGPPPLRFNDRSGDSGDSGEGRLQSACHSTDVDIDNNNHNFVKNNVNISQNEGLQEPQALPQEPSLPSPSAAELSEEEKAKLRARYDASRARINKELKRI